MTMRLVIFSSGLLLFLVSLARANTLRHEQLPERFSTQEIRHLDPVTGFSLEDVRTGRRLDTVSADSEPHRIRGNVDQPHPDKLRIRFDALNQGFDYTLTVMAELFPETSTVAVDMGDAGVQHHRHRLTSYSWYGDDAFASATVLSDGAVHAVIFRDGELFQVDAIRTHAEDLSEPHARALEERSPHGMVAFRHSDRVVSAKEKHCGLQHADATGDAKSHHKHKLVSPDEAVREMLGIGGGAGLRRHRRLDASDAGDPDLWRGCYDEIGIAIDRVYYDLAGSVERVTEMANGVIADANTIYAFQMNIYLSIGQIYVKTTSGGESWNNAPGDRSGSCSKSASAQLDGIQNWAGDSQSRSGQQQFGLWHLLTSCHYSGTVGVAYVGAICNGRQGYHTGVSSVGRSGTGWTTFAHEIGHNFGASHSFEEGQGNTGGIMDYGRGNEIDGIYQFNSRYRKNEVCREINNNINCRYFESYMPECGNGIVERGEECECPDGLSTCPCCNACRLADGAECGGGECCDDECKFSDVTTTCEGGTKVCNNGQCTSVQCDIYNNLRFCVDPDKEPENNGCTTRCTYQGQCQSLGGFSPKGLNYAPEGARCFVGTQQGSCESGQCVVESTDTYEWRTSEWSVCSATCTPDGGQVPFQSRTVTCVTVGSGAPVNAAQCTSAGSKPSATRACQPNAPPRCPTFEWAKEADVSYGPCTNDCDGGEQVLLDTNLCVRTTYSPMRTSRVDNAQCEGGKATNERPPDSRVCGTDQCPAAWYCASGTCTPESDWSSCSAPCDGGSQSRVVTCRRTRNGVVEQNNAFPNRCNQAEKPLQQRSCNDQDCPNYAWATSSYGSCVTSETDPTTGLSCGDGLQTRAVTCVDTNVPVPRPALDDESLCDASPKPESSRACSTGDCPSSVPGGTSYAWIYGESVCACLLSEHAPVASLGSVTFSVFTHESETDQPCAYCWCSTRRWSECSKQCGEGSRFREVFCLRLTAEEESGPKPELVTTAQITSFKDGERLVEDGLCTKGKPVPQTSETCMLAPCPVFEWRTGAWSECSVSCGEGTRTRDITCVDTSVEPPKTATETDCVGALGRMSKPSATQSCSLGVCTQPPAPPPPCKGFECFGYWKRSEFSACSKPCGGGEKTRSVTCVSIVTKRPLDEFRCLWSRPSESARCNVISCPRFVAGSVVDGGNDGEFVVGEWGPCSAACDDGTQNRTILCIDASGASVNPSRCSGILPEVSRPCNVRPCPHWHRGLWNECTHSCGGGERRRDLTCRLPHDEIYLGVKVEPKLQAALCPLLKPEVVQSCNADPCSNYYWRMGPWSQCSQSCDPSCEKAGSCIAGIEQRQAKCMEAEVPGERGDGDTEVGSSNCEESAGGMPPTSRQCNAKRCPIYQWGAALDKDGNEWTECDSVCGGGVQRRVIQCHDLAGDIVFGYDIPYEIVDESYCAGQEKLPETRECNAATSVCSAGKEDDLTGECREGLCFCKPGWTGDFCDVEPAMSNALLGIDPSVRTNGVATGDIIEVTWLFGGKIDDVDVLLEPLNDGVQPRVETLLPSYVSKATRNEGIFLFDVPERPSLSDSSFVLRLWHTDELNSLSPSFRFGNPCGYKQCNTPHGLCNDLSGLCECTDGYTGDLCEISPCGAALCVPGEQSGVADCVVTAAEDATGMSISCICDEDHEGERCEHLKGCANVCDNGGVASGGFFTESGGDRQCGDGCDCPVGTQWGGAMCETCELECENGDPNADCTKCLCNDGWFGDGGCHCEYEATLVFDETIASADPTFVSTVVRAIPAESTLESMVSQGGLTAADAQALKDLLEHDLLHAAKDGVPCYRGEIEVSSFTKTGTETLLVTYQLRQECFDVSLYRNNAQHRNRALSESAAETQCMRDAGIALEQQSTDRWSTLRTRGVVTRALGPDVGPTSSDGSGFDTLTLGLIVGGSLIGVALIVGSLVVLYRRRGQSTNDGSRTKYRHQPNVYDLATPSSVFMPQPEAPAQMRATPSHQISHGTRGCHLSIE